MSICPCCSQRHASRYYRCKCGWIVYLFQTDDVVFQGMSWAQCYDWDMALPVFVVAPKHVRVKAWLWWASTRLPVIALVAGLFLYFA